MRNKVFHCIRSTRALKSDLFTMEYPIFVLDGKAKDSPLKYEHNGISIEVTVKGNDEGIGRATSKDKEILMFCLTQMMNKNVFETEKMFMVSFTVYDFLKSVGRGVSGANYQQVFDGLKRLSHTYVLTNHLFKGRRNYNSFSLIDEYEVSKTLGYSTITITLGSWLTRQATDNPPKILTLQPGYLKLKRPFERRLYELCRKFCGSKKSFEISIDNLRRRMTPDTPKKEFKRLIKAICQVQGKDKDKDKDKDKESLLFNYTLSLEDQLIKISNNAPAVVVPIKREGTASMKRELKRLDRMVTLPYVKASKGCG